MSLSSRILVNHNLKRYFGKTSANLVNKYAGREAKFFKKMVQGDSGKRKWHVNKSPSSNPFTPDKLTSKHVTRRVSVLNTLFMEHITELMASGEASSELLGKNIEVTHVRVTPDFKLVLVYWFSKLEGQLLETEKLLEDCAFGLRHELTQLRVIGRVPLIKFVRNKQLSALDSLEERFRSADYGDDYEPVITARTLPKPQPTLVTKLSPEVKKRIAELEQEEQPQEECDEALYDVKLPPMRHDVLGLDHHAIMSKVKSALKTSRDAVKNRLDNVVTFAPSGNPSEFNPLAFRREKEDSLAFTEFLVKRQLEEKRKMRRERRDMASSFPTDLETDSNDNNDHEFVREEQDVDIFEDISLEDIKRFE